MPASPLPLPVTKKQRQALTAVDGYPRLEPSSSFKTSFKRPNRIEKFPDDSRHGSAQSILIPMGVLNILRGPSDAEILDVAPKAMPLGLAKALAPIPARESTGTGKAIAPAPVSKAIFCLASVFPMSETPVSHIASETSSDQTASNWEGTYDFIKRIRQRIAQVVVGQDVVVERLLIALFTGGHVLLQGVPGLAKTLVVSALAKSIHLDFSRIQFTVDLLPSDIVGSEILDQRSNEFRVHRGPIFTNLLLADEINRAAPKVQSALLEAMQEHKVTIGNETFRLPAPFLVIATQNPVEQAGTFELPEAQLDRFMLCHRLGYPTPEEEREVLRRNARLGIRREGNGAIARTEFDVLEQESVGTADDLITAMEAVQQVYVSDTFTDHVVDIINLTRNDSRLDFGCSPRAGIALIKASRARALIHGRHYVVPEDLYALAEDVILHRIRLNYEALADGITGPQVLQEILVDVSGLSLPSSGR